MGKKNMMGNERRRIKGSKAVDGFESQNKESVVDVGVQRQTVERCEERHRVRVVKVARECRSGK